MRLCEYGCGREAKFAPKKGMPKWCCEKNWQSCPGSNNFQKRKKTLEEIHKLAENQNYKLLSTAYINSRTKLKFKCPRGHEFWLRWDDLKQGVKCSVCVGNRKKTIKEVREYVENQSYELLSTKYVNSRTKMEFRCPYQHVFWMVWSDFQQGSRCPTCANIKMSISRLGPNNQNWKGGVSKDPYCDLWNIKEFKEMIKAREGYKCINPYCSGKSTRLSIHHINYNKLDCDKENLISICASCNSAANKDREWHTAWYQAIMYRRYEYLY